MKTRMLLGFILALAAATWANRDAGLSADAFTHLNPGGPASLEETVPVHVVFVGFDGLVDEAAFLGDLPATYSPIVRSRLWYGVTEQLGLHYDLQYHVTFTDAAWNDAFFAALEALATPASLTLFQQLYNAQAGNVLDVSDNNFIDAPAVEKWLIDNEPPGVDTRRNTIFFINWWGRSDFRFHVYTKFGEPDPDTGFDFGVGRHSRKIVAWGGTPVDDAQTGLGLARGERRVWFFDVSAGPESWAGSWNVDDADLDGDGRPDYRLPAIWEYLSEGGYRAASELTADLARVARFVGINLLFTTSPLYPPYLAPLGLPESVTLDVNTYEGWRGVNASQTLLTPSLLLDNIAALHPIAYDLHQESLPFKQGALNCYQLWYVFNRCYPTRPYPAFANLFVYNALHLNETRNGAGDYRAMLFNYATGDNRASGLLGFADDNWIDGTQSGVFGFVSPLIRQLGYGLTTTQIHETGHHLGMSHPHDGWDSELERDYGATGAFYFAWLGDESNTVMSYIDLNWDFSQFDRDNFLRFQAAGYVTNANAIAAQVLASPNAALGFVDLQAADVESGLAADRLAAHDYAGAFGHARAAYSHAKTAAANASVAVHASDNGWTVLPAVRGNGPQKREYSHVDRYGPGTKRWLE